MACRDAVVRILRGVASARVRCAAVNRCCLRNERGDHVRWCVDGLGYLLFQLWTLVKVWTGNRQLKAELQNACCDCKAVAAADAPSQPTAAAWPADATPWRAGSRASVDDDHAPAARA